MATLIVNGAETAKSSSSNTVTTVNLCGVSLPGGSIASYKYDVFGRRSEKTVGGHTTEFLCKANA
nr:hypothetical protein [Pseudomonas fluorescens]